MKRKKKKKETEMLESVLVEKGKYVPGLPSAARALLGWVDLMSGAARCGDPQRLGWTTVLEMSGERESLNLPPMS